MALIPGKNWEQHLVAALDAILMRGQDSLGITFVYSAYKTKTLKFNHEQIKNFDFEKFLVDLNKEQFPQVILASARAQPLQEVLPTNEKNNPPFQVRDCVLVHNGIVSNDKELKLKYNLKPESENDSEILLRLLTFYDGDGGFHPERISEVEGTAALILAIGTDVYYYRDFKPLWLAKYQGNTLLISTSQMVDHVFPSENDDNYFELQKLEVPMYKWCKISMKGGIIRKTVEMKKYFTQRRSFLPETDKKKVLVLCSGGIDSVTTAVYLEKVLEMKVTLVHFNYGQKAAVAEWSAVKDIAEYYKFEMISLDQKWLGELGSSALTENSIDIPEGIKSCETNLCWVPARNLIMISILAAYAEANGFGNIALGANLQENSSPYPDNESIFTDKFNDLLNYGCIKHIRLLTPLAEKMKEEIIQLGTGLGIPYHLTHSCDKSIASNGEYKMCGECGCCYSSAMAFRKARIVDPRLKKYITLGADIVKDFKRYDDAKW